MKRFLFITILLWLASEAVAQRTTTRYLSLGCNIQQVGSSSGKPHVSCNCSDTGGTYDASNIAVGDTLYFNDGGVGYALPIDSIVTPGVPTLVVRADWTGLGLVLVPTGRGGISRSAVNGLKGTIAGLTAADNQYLEEDFVSNIGGAISFVSLYKGTTTKFAADTDVAPDTTGAPSTNEIEAWNYTTQDTNWLNSIIFYTGGDDSTAVITYIYFIDSDGNASLLESPSDPLNLTRRIIPSPAFANAAAPLDSEALTFINALSPPALPSTIFVQADGAVPGSGTSDNPETVWVYDGTNVTRIKDFPRKFEVPGSAFSDSTAATGTEVLTWLGSNPQAGNYLLAYHVGSGTVDKPDFAWWIAGDNNVGYSDIVTIKEPGGVADGDKTDIDVSSSGTVWTIDTGAITSLKILDGTIAWADISTAFRDSIGRVHTVTLLQDSILVVKDRNGTELSRDTIAVGRSGGDAALKDTISHTSHGFSVGNLINIQSVTGIGQLADADVDSLFAVGIITEVIDANSYVIQTSGIATISGVVAGQQYYTSSTPGAVTTTAPSKVQVAYQGIATNTARLVFDRFSQGISTTYLTTVSRDATLKGAGTAADPLKADTSILVTQADLNAAVLGSGASGVVTFEGRSGTINSASGDYNMGEITNTPSGNIAATTGQAAINELDSEKLSNTAGTVTTTNILDATIAWADISQPVKDSIPDLTNVVVSTNTTKAVTGKAVENWIDTVMLKEFTGLGLPAFSSLDNYYGLTDIEGSYISSAGATVTNALYRRTDYIPIPDGVTSITYKGNWNSASTYLAFYDANKVFISNVARGGATITEKNNIAVPSTAKYVRASGETGVEITIYPEQFTTTIPTSIENNRLDVIEIQHFLGDTIGENLVSSQGVATITGSYINASGGVAVNASFQYTDYVYLQDSLEEITYKGNWNNPSIYLAFYDANKVFISNVARGGATITEKNNIAVPSTAKYVRASGATGTAIEIIPEDFSSDYGRDIARITTIESNLQTSFPYPGTDLVEFWEVDTTGSIYINNLGNTQSAPANYFATGFVPIQNGDSLRYFGNWTNSSTYLAYYDQDSVFISSLAYNASLPTNRPIKAPANAWYIRASSNTGNGKIKLVLETARKISNQKLSIEVARIDNELAGKADTSDIFGAEPADLITRSYGEVWTKMPNFVQNYLEKDDDCNIVFQGTSITRGSGYSTIKTNPSLYPAYCDETDIPGLAWDYLSAAWPGQQYRRYDSGYITEASGTWNTLTADSTWDDAPKDIASRMSLSASAQLSFVVPDSAWAFRFVYRSERHGDNCTIAVAAGNNKLQVKDTVGTWVEANGYVFSTYEPHDSTSSGPGDYGDYSLGYGNTNATKKLHFRARNADGTFDQLTGDKTVTITKSSNTAKRLSYWGVEWSRERYMFSIINAGRKSGRYNDELTPLGGSSIYFAKTDIMYFEPDLIMCEISHNGWGGTIGGSIDKTRKWYFSENSAGDSIDVPLSLRALTGGFDTCDIAFYTPSSPHSTFTADGEVAAGVYSSGRRVSVFDLRDAHTVFFRQVKTAYAFADSHGALREAGTKYYGSYNAATTPSSNTGWTLLRSDGVHPNQRGYAVMWKAIQPIFQF